MKTKNMVTCSVAILFSILSFAQESLSTQKNVNNDRAGSQNITRDQLLEIKNIEEVLSNFPKDAYEVTSYRLSIYERDKNPAEFETNDNHLTLPMRERIKTTSPGAKIYVEYIKGRLKSSNDGVTRQFPPAAFVIIKK